MIKFDSEFRVYRRVCKKCESREVRQKQLKNLEHHKAVQKAWREANPGYNKKQYRKDPKRYRAYQRDWVNNSPGAKEKIAQRQQKQIATTRKTIDFIKKETACADCRRFFPPICMDFDHRPGRIKLFNISRRRNSLTPLAKILKEIAKCDVVCACCHRIRTRKRQNT